MRQPYASERPSWPSECMPSAISQHEIQPVQRFTINEVQSTAGRAVCLPLERQAQLSRHPSSSRLQPAEGRAVLAGTQSTGCGSFGSNLSAASIHYSLPTTGPSTLDQRLYPSQQAFRGGSPAYMSRVLFCTFTVQAEVRLRGIPCMQSRRSCCRHRHRHQCWSLSALFHRHNTGVQSAAVPSCLAVPSSHQSVY